MSANHKPTSPSSPSRASSDAGGAGGWRSFFHPEILQTVDRDYWKRQFGKDVMAGVIVGVVALPLAIAFAVASGVSPEKGLATAVVAGFLISLLGGSRVQIGGPTGAFIVIVFGIVQKYGLDGLMISTMMAGAMLVAFGLLKFGNVIKFIPHPVIVGFTSGIAVTIFSTQITDGLGLRIEEVPEKFVGRWRAYLSHLDTINPWAAALAGGTVLIMVAGRKWFPKIPGSLVALIPATAAVWFFDLPGDTIGKRFGEIPATLSFSLPKVEWGRLTEYLQPAFTIAVLGAIESLLSAVVADGMIGGRHRSNTELVAQGVANLVTPLFGGIPATGAIARTATNVKNGGRTPVAGLVHALTLLAIMMALGPYAKMIPMACLAGILAVVAYNMSEWRSFVGILTASRSEAAVLLATFGLTVLVDLTVAIEIGMVMAAFLFVRRMSELGTVFSATGADDTSDPDTAPVEHYEKLPAGIDVFEISGPFFFASARHYQEVLEDFGERSKVVVIRMRHVPFIDTTGLRNFRAAISLMRANGRAVILSGVRKSVARDLNRSGLADEIGRENIFPNFEAASAHAIKLVSETEDAADATESLKN